MCGRYLNETQDFYRGLAPAIGGFAFDGVFFNAPNTTVYAQWRGWMDVLAALRAAFPDMVIDNRLSAHAYGPWYQLSGSYAEPIAGDENPETCACLLTRTLSAPQPL